VSLDARMVVRRGGFVLDLSLYAESAGVVAVLGPNGAGKTTLLRALAGLLPLDAGRVVLDGAVLEDARDRVRVPAERRPVGVVFQDYLLFPHLSALENVAFGLRARGVERSAARRAARGWLDRVGLSAYSDARPRALSGGQAQRVALARALATDPLLLLLDEPLAALDAATRAQVRSDLRRHLRAFGGCTLLVTHDALDAMVLADRIVVVEDGRVVQDGPPGEVARSPRTDYVARLVGLNLVRGRATARGAGTVVDVGGGVQLAVAHAVAPGEAFVAFTPAAVALFVDRPEGSPRNTWPARVGAVEQHGDVVRVRLDGALPALADVTPAAVAELELAPGRQVWAAVKATETAAYPA